jgi:hypothetical protein
MLGDRIKSGFLSLLAKTVRELEPKAKYEYGYLVTPLKPCATHKQRHYIQRPASIAEGRIVRASSRLGEIEGASSI